MVRGYTRICPTCEEPIYEYERTAVCAVCGEEVHDECCVIVNGVKVCKDCARKVGEELPIWA